MKQYKIGNKIVKANNVVDAVKKLKDTYYQQNEIYHLCVKNQYYTRGSNAEYDRMLTAVYENKWSPEQIAQDINEHSVANWGQYDKILREVKAIMSVKDSIKDSSFEDYLEHMYSYGVKYREVPNDRASGVAYEIRYKDYATGQELKLKASQYGKHLISHEPGRLVVGDSVKDDDYSYEVIKEQIGNENFGKELLLKKAYNGLTRGSMTKEQYEKLVQEIKSIKDTCKDEDVESLSKEEEQAIEDYKKAIAETKDPKLLRLFAHILKEEIEHLEELQNEEVVDTKAKAKDNLIFEKLLKEDKEIIKNFSLGYIDFKEYMMEKYNMDAGDIQYYYNWLRNNY